MLPRHVLTALCLIVLTFSAEAASATIDQFTATESDGAVSVRLRLAHAMDEPWRLEGLQSGLPLAFIYQVELVRKRENWFDTVLAYREIEMVATYNSLTREYLLNYRKDRKLVSSENVRSLEELEKKMTTLSEERLFEIRGRSVGRLRIKARAILGRSYVLQVIPKAVTTDWEAVRVQDPSAP